MSSLGFRLVGLHEDSLGRMRADCQTLWFCKEFGSFCLIAHCCCTLSGWDWINWVAGNKAAVIKLKTGLKKKSPLHAKLRTRGGTFENKRPVKRKDSHLLHLSNYLSWWSHFPPAPSPARGAASHGEPHRACCRVQHLWAAAMLGALCLCSSLRLSFVCRCFARAVEVQPKCFFFPNTSRCVCSPCFFT